MGAIVRYGFVQGNQGVTGMHLNWRVGYGGGWDVRGHYSPVLHRTRISVCLRFSFQLSLYVSSFISVVCAAMDDWLLAMR